MSGYQDIAIKNIHAENELNIFYICPAAKTMPRNALMQWHLGLLGIIYNNISLESFLDQGYKKLNLNEVTSFAAR